ncbi:sodium-dependent bicarbonate transport family permease [Gemmatimonas sp.]|uniref:sodium-dependent bicarbonate transport family permease n=1 Tax=Gemmatimonas sp. TaxID=1962908 RepID=UPI0033406587
MIETLKANLLSPIPLAFALGIATRLMRSEFSLPKDIYSALSIYLLFALGLKGGVELAHASFDTIIAPAGVTLLLGCITPLSTYAVMRYVGRFGTSDAAGMAAHYGSVSAVTFIAAQQFMQRVGAPAEGFMPTLLTLLESPGIHIALALGAIQRNKQLLASGGDTGAHGSIKEVLHEVLTGRTMILLVGGLIVGYFMGESGWKAVSPFFDSGFKGALMLFLLEMGIVAGDRLGDLKKVGPFLLAFGIIMPLIHGAIGVVLGEWAGLSPSGAAVLGTMAASASYIAAPPAVRLTLPEANPTYSLTAALAITFPFNILAGIPIYYSIAQAIAS